MIKKINGYTIHIERLKRYLKVSLGRYNTGSNKMHLNLKEIDHLGLTTDKMETKVCLILTHEYMHKLLFLTEDENTCDTWDNISDSFIEYGSS